MGSHVSNGILLLLRKQFEAVHFPNILIMTNKCFEEMLFHAGSARIQTLKWLFSEINLNKQGLDPFDAKGDKQLKEELIEFAVVMGFCVGHEKHNLVLCEKGAAIEKHVKFWLSIVDSAKQMQELKRQNSTYKNTNDFIEKMVKEGVLQDITESSQNLSLVLCPSYISKKKVDSTEKRLALQKTLKDLKETTITEKCIFTSSISKENLREKILQETSNLVSILKNSKASLEDITNSMAEAQQLSYTQHLISSHFDQIVQSSKPMVQLVEDRTNSEIMLTNINECNSVPLLVAENANMLAIKEIDNIIGQNFITA